jgi:hypothetical protein
LNPVRARAVQPVVAFAAVTVVILQDAERIHASKPRANWNPDHCGQLRPNGFFGTFISLPVVLEGFDATMAVRYTRFTLTCKPS